MTNPNRDIDAAKNREENAAWMLEYLTGRTVIMMRNEFCKFDFLLAKTVGGIRTATSIAEYRSRPKVRINQYPTFRISKGKIDAMRQYAPMMGVDAFLFVEWENTPLMYVNVLQGKWDVLDDWTRRDQERANDRPEQAYEIPIHQFKEVQLS